jgi:hypothetical protein
MGSMIRTTKPRKNQGRTIPYWARKNCSFFPVSGSSCRNRTHDGATTSFSPNLRKPAESSPLNPTPTPKLYLALVHKKGAGQKHTNFRTSARVGGFLATLIKRMADGANRSISE